MDDPEMEPTVRRELERLAINGLPPHIMPGRTRQQTREAAANHLNEDASAVQNDDGWTLVTHKKRSAQRLW